MATGKKKKERKKNMKDILRFLEILVSVELGKIVSVIHYWFSWS